LKQFLLFFSFLSMNPLSVLLFIFLFGSSALVAGSEIAILSLPQHKVKALLRQNKPGARSLQQIKSNIDTLLITVAILLSLLTTVTAAFATQLSLTMASIVKLDPAIAVTIAT
jgi:CBS domain containing-hemolysin-like protein